jgi:histidinol-phosphate aminotransferase
VLTFVCSPNNPTGRVEPTERIVSVLERAPGLVVVDEAYGQFAPNSALELREGHDNLVVVRTFSKTWSLASLRLGYAIARPEVVEALFAVTLPYHLDSLKQLAGRLALAYRDDMVERVERLKAERARLMAALLSMALEVCPSDANFILFRPRARDAKEVWSDLLAASVLVRDISTVPHLEGFLRVTIGSPEENDAFLAALRASLA